MRENGTYTSRRGRVDHRRVASGWVIPSGPEGAAVLDEIKAALMRLYEMDEAEAVGRINRRWGQSLDLTQPSSVAALKAETPEHWARHVALGDGAFWGESKPTPWP